MFGWNGRLLRVDLTKGKTKVEEYSLEMARKFIGGRGFAIKILWDELEPGLASSVVICYEEINDVK